MKAVAIEDRNFVVAQCSEGGIIVFIRPSYSLLIGNQAEGGYYFEINRTRRAINPSMR